MDDEITTDEAAKILGVTARHVRWYRGQGLLAGRMVGAKVLLFPRAAVEALIGKKPKKTGRPKGSKTKNSRKK